MDGNLVVSVAACPVPEQGDLRMQTRLKLTRSVDHLRFGGALCPGWAYAAARSRRLKAATPASAAVRASPVSQVMAVQLRVVAGTGPRWERIAVSSSQWLLVMLDPMISMRNDHKITAYRIGTASRGSSPYSRAPTPRMNSAGTATFRPACIIAASPMPPCRAATPIQPP